MARARRQSKVDDFYRRVADKLVGRIQEGTATWTQAWKPGERTLPYNVKTGKPYRGGNSVWLANTGEERGYSDARWGTYRQVKDLGGQVRRGERGCAILFWQFEARRLARDRDGRPVLDEKGNPVYEKHTLRSPRVYTYTVFNADQCNGLPARTQRRSAETWDRHEEAEQVFRKAGAVVEHSGDNRAFYDLQRDRIILPYREQFPSAPTYYQTALHELGHWTGHPDRLNRETLTKGLEHGFASRMYAREELRAEISSMITADRLKLGHDPSRHADYVGSWVEALQDDPREIYRAAKDAQDISDYLLDRQRGRQQERESRIRVAEPERTAPGSRFRSPAARDGEARSLAGHRRHKTPFPVSAPSRERIRHAGPER